MTNIGSLHSPIASRNPVLPSFLRKRLCKKPSPSRVTCGKPLRVWLFYWDSCFRRNDECWVFCTVSFAGMTNIGLLHSLFRRNDECWFFAQPLKSHFRKSARLCRKPSLCRTGGKPNPLNPPYQGDFLDSIPP